LTSPLGRGKEAESKTGCYNVESLESPTKAMRQINMRDPLSCKNALTLTAASSSLDKGRQKRYACINSLRACQPLAVNFFQCVGAGN